MNLSYLIDHLPYGNDIEIMSLLCHIPTVSCDLVDLVKSFLDDSVPLIRKRSGSSCVKLFSTDSPTSSSTMSSQQDINRSTDCPSLRNLKSQAKAPLGDEG